MNERIERLALKAGLLNYVDNESPRHYFVRADINEEDIEMFAELIVRECIRLGEQIGDPVADDYINMIEEHFGIKE